MQFYVPLAILLCAGDGVLGLRIAMESKNSCDEPGRWVMNADGSADLTDENCNVPPKFDAHKFCTEQLKCSSMLLVGDSIMLQKFEALAIAFYPIGSSQDLSMDLFKDTSGMQSKEMELEFYNPEEREVYDFTVNCSDKEFLDSELGKLKQKKVIQNHMQMLPKQMPICQKSCAQEVQLAYIRHDHLNGLKFGEAKISQCDNWKDELNKFPHLVIGTGSHVGDHPDLLSNKNGVWESRANELFQFLQKNHPQGIIWTPAHYGLRYSFTKCPDLERWNSKPLNVDEIDKDKYGGSWVQIHEINKVYKKMLKEMLPEALILDHEAALSMRHDCRKDSIHFLWGDASPIYWQIRDLQHLMSHPNRNDQNKLFEVKE